MLFLPLMPSCWMGKCVRPASFSFYTPGLRKLKHISSMSRDLISSTIVLSCIFSERGIVAAVQLWKLPLGKLIHVVVTQRQNSLFSVYGAGEHQML